MNPPPYLPPDERQSTSARPLLLAALIAIPILALMACGMIFVFNAAQKAAQKRAAIEDIQATAKEAQSNLKKNFDPQKGITNMDLSNINKLRDRLQNASQTFSGDDAVFAKVMAGYLNRLQSAGTNYQDALIKLRAAHVLQKFDPSDKGQIASRREVVHQFVDANNALMQAIKSSEDLVRADLEDAKIGESKIDSFMQGFHTSVVPRNTLLIKIRQCDDRMGTAMLDVLDTLEKQSGHWRIDQNDQLRFENTAALKTYNEDILSIREAGEDQLKFQKNLVNQPSPPGM